MPDRGAFAIVGIGCRFPGGVDSPLSMWALLAGGEEGVREVPPDRWSADALHDPDPGRRGRISTRYAGFIDEPARFDAELFGISAREAASMDPQHRLLLEVAWAAVEDAGRDPRALAGSDTAVFVGLMLQDYLAIQTTVHARELITGQTVVGMGGCMAANRISHALDLRGPSVVLDTACSSSLVAVHLACQAIQLGDASQALVGGVNLMLRPEPTIAASQARMLAPDGRCKGFDARADGYARSEGAGVVLLRPLADALADGDRVYAVIRGSAVNQDGRTPRVTLPSGAAQQEVVRAACRRAGLVPGELQYVEAHGTGTPVGDPIEARALGEVLSDGRDADACLLGSIKSNIGHAEAAAGVAAVIKTALALHHGQVPPHLHFRSAPEGIDLAALRLRIPTALEPWPASAGRRVAGVNSFGLGGTNAHVILEGVPAGDRKPDDGAAQLVIASARTSTELDRVCARLAAHVRSESDASLAELSAASMRRARLSHRVGVVARSRSELLELLDAHAAGERRGELVRKVASARPRVVFVFGGTGQVGSALGWLLDEQPVRAALLACERGLGWSPIEALRRADAQLDRLELAQPLLFAVQVGLAALWRSWGVEPDVVIGHSAGEVAAAHVAGALELEAALALIQHRSRLQARCAGTGGMLAVNLDRAAAEALIEAHPNLCIAAINSPRSVTIAGPLAELAALELEVAHRMLPGDVAFHSPAMDPLIPELLAALEGMRAEAPRTRWCSSVTGRFVDEPPGPEYWARNLREPVRFGAGIETICAIGADGPTVFLELGVHPVLAAPIRECLDALGNDEAAVLASLRREQPERETLLRALAQLHVLGVPARIEATCDSSTRLVSLPSYPFAGERHWVESELGRRLRLGLAQVDASEPVVAPPEPTPIVAPPADAVSLDEQVREEVAAVLGVAPSRLDVDRPLSELGLDSVMALELAAAIDRRFGVRVPVGRILDGPSVAMMIDWLRGAGPSDDGSSWLLPIARPASPRLRLICIPHAGGSATVFRPWADLLPDVELWAVRLPGSLDRAHERPFDRMQALVDALLEQLDGHLAAPFAIYGHSLGALISLALARELRARERPGPAALCVAAHPSPSARSWLGAASEAELDAALSDPAFLREEVGAFEELAGDEASLRAIGPALRAGYRLIQGYRPDPDPRLDCPIFAYAGADDRSAEAPSMRGWADYTRADLRLRTIAGGHLFLRTAAPELTRALRSDLGLDPFDEARRS